MGAAGATLALPAAVRDLVDHGLIQPAGIELAARMAQVRLRFLALFAVTAALAVFTAARFYMMSWIGERVTADLRRAVYAHVLCQSPQFFETLKTGEVISRLTADATVIQGAVGSSLATGLRSLVMALGTIGMLVATNPAPHARRGRGDHPHRAACTAASPA
jgi:ATP-binding cassette, subfamily B, bacterial